MSPVPLGERQLVQIARLRNEREVPEAALGDATRVASVLGGYLHSATITSASLRIPAPHLHEALQSLSSPGG